MFSRIGLIIFFLFPGTGFASSISLDEIFSKLDVQEISPVTINGKPVAYDTPSAVCILAGYKSLVSLKFKKESVTEAYRNPDSSTLVLEKMNGETYILTSVTCAR